MLAEGAITRSRVLDLARSNCMDVGRSQTDPNHPADAAPVIALGPGRLYTVANLSVPLSESPAVGEFGITIVQLKLRDLPA